MVVSKETNYFAAQDLKRKWYKTMQLSMIYTYTVPYIHVVRSIKAVKGKINEKQ